MTGLEPAASGVTGRRSNQLSYTPCGPANPGRRHVLHPPGGVKQTAAFGRSWRPIRVGTGATVATPPGGGD